MESIIAAFFSFLLLCVVFTAAVAAGSIIAMSCLALSWPHVSRLYDAWNDWFKRRTGW